MTQERKTSIALAVAELELVEKEVLARGLIYHHTAVSRKAYKSGRPRRVCTFTPEQCQAYRLCKLWDRTNWDVLKG